MSSIPITSRRAFRRTDDHRPGEPKVQLITEPLPLPLGPTSVLIKVHAVALNYRDANIANGGNPWPVVPHGIPGNDAAGEVIALGESVKTLVQGDRVAPITDTENITGREPTRSWLAADEDGVLADYLVFDERKLCKLPTYLDWEAASIIPCAGVTAWTALKDVTIGQSVLIQGTGGVSMFALKLARAAGLKVILSSSSDEKLQKMRQQFPSPPLLTVNYRLNSQWEEEVLRLTDGVGVDLVVEVGGCQSLVQSMKCTRRGGIVSQVGYLSQQDPSQLAEFLSVLIDRRIVLRGINAGSKHDMDDLCTALTATRIDFDDIIDSTEPFEKADQAIEYIWQGKQIGKLVLHVVYILRIASPNMSIESVRTTRSADTLRKNPDFNTQLVSGFKSGGGSPPASSGDEADMDVRSFPMTSSYCSHSNPEMSENKDPLDDEPTHDAVFGEITDEGPNYRNVGFLGTVILMMKTQIGLGVLSVPTAFNVLGIIPGVICLCVIASITTWSNYVIGQFKTRHPEVYGIDDAGALIFGPVGRVVLSVAFCLYWIFVTGSGILGISIGLNAVSTHAACTAIFVAVSALLGFMFSSVRTLGHITWLAWIGLPCILTAILIVTIAVSIQSHPPSTPTPSLPWTSDYKLLAHPTFTSAIAAIASLVFSFSGVPGFFAIVSEMRSPRQYTAALLLCQAGVTAIYTVIGCVVYYYCGSEVASPALGSAGGLVKKVAYGFALPGLVVTTTIVTHIPAKYIFVHILRGSKHLTSNSATHWMVWLSCTAGVTVVGYIIASAIPEFDTLVALIGALLGTLMCFQPMGCMWLYDNWGRGDRRSTRWWVMVCWSVFVVVLGSFLMVAGTYGAVVGVRDSYQASGGSTAFSCADNSNSG
ncbi:hypothetical protein FE257_010273 [Aspergillus nanangensis]|uniref:Enoyl reductase (ER) domain-containing protein n=1 Tax=Aspergillus nanangensis TaxID=2582783 RepID=A0AAD4CKH4_ASPNN|nr:hypothetical protein FE257_010273 [Aspergillus nanangensis]